MASVPMRRLRLSEKMVLRSDFLEAWRSAMEFHIAKRKDNSGFNPVTDTYYSKFNRSASPPPSELGRIGISSLQCLSLQCPILELEKCVSSKLKGQNGAITTRKLKC